MAQYDEIAEAYTSTEENRTVSNYVYHPEQQDKGNQAVNYKLQS